MSAFKPDVNAALIKSPSSVGLSSEILGPSALGLLSSIPSPSSHSASESSTYTIVSGALPVNNSLELMPSSHPKVITQSADNTAKGHMVMATAIAANS